MNALEFAIQMELDGQNYYLEQAELNKGNHTETVCLILARDEEYHAKILKHKLNNLPYELEDTDTYLKCKSIFNDLGNVKSKINEHPTQLEFYRSALEKEKESIALYAEFLSQTKDKSEQEILNFLIEQEKIHLTILDHLATDLRHAEEWVESAEFGLRNEIY